MVTSTQPAASSTAAMILDALDQKIARLPAADREQILPDLSRLRHCLEDMNQDFQDCRALLQESVERFDLLADSNPLLIWTTDEQGGNQYINQTYRDLLQVSLDEVRGLDWQKYLHPEDVPGYSAAYQQAVREQREFRGEVRIRGADGTWRWIVTYEKPRFAADGAFLGYIGNGIDITGRKQAEELLQETLARTEWLARLPRENPNPVARMDDTGRVLYHNPAAAELPGWSFEAGQPVPEPFRKTLQQAYAAGKKIENDMELGGKNYSITIMPFPEEHYANLYGLDITERKRAEASLQQAHAALEKANSELTGERNRLLAIMNALPIGLAILDQNGGLLEANANYEAVWGAPRPRTNSVEDYELYKAWWAETGQRVQLDEWASALAVRKGETTIGQFIEIQKFDTSHAFIWNSSAPICDAEGKITGAVVTIMDITERIRAEKALQESERSLRQSQERFRVALASVPLMVYTCDREQRYTWIYNPLRGFQPQEVLGKRDDEILPPEAVAELMAARQEALDTGQGSVKEVKIPQDGKDTYYILTTEPIKNTRGHITGLTCSAIDITGQKLLEIEREENEMRMQVQARLMEYRERERQEIARDLHDGPIQLISGTIFHLQVVKEAVQDSLMKLELEQATLNLKGAVRELRDIMNELRPPAIIAFGFAKTARLYAEDFRERYPELEIHLQLFDDDKILPESIRLALFRIFQESLNNIAKHSGASRVWVQLAKKGAEIQLKIRDNGNGFAVPADLARQTQSGHYGLAGMKERAEAMGGRFSVTSAPGKGTTTFVAVPAPIDNTP